MRTAFITTLTALASKDPSVMLLTGDLGYTVFEGFRDTFPSQYLNVGVAEQNMMSIAAGLSMCGKKVFAYSIIPFATFRCLEQIRDDICYHSAAVCIVGVGAGYSYGHMGATHHALEDIAVMRSLPNMTVVSPGDPLEVAGSVQAIHALKGPCYLRLGKAGEPVLHHKNPQIVLGQSLRLSDGGDVTLIATGSMLEQAVKAATILGDIGIAARVISMHTIKPIDTQALVAAASETQLIVTVEEHSVIGGLGSAVAEALANLRLPVHQLMCAAPDSFSLYTGSQVVLRKRAGLNSESIARKVAERFASLSARLSAAPASLSANQTVSGRTKTGA